MAGTLLFSCETDPEKLEIVKPYPKSDQYYADLRDYKNSDHEIVFGWFGNWSATGASASNYMKSLPTASTWSVCGAAGRQSPKPSVRIWRIPSTSAV